MRSVLIVSSLLASSAVFAQAPAAPVAPAQPAAPAAAAPADSTTPPAPAAPVAVVEAKPDPLKDAADLIENQANTRANLEKAVKLYEDALKDASVPAKSRVLAYSDLSRAFLRLGDLAKGDAAIALYEKGRAAAQKAAALDPKHADAIFWDMANQASIGRTKGVMNSLFMLPELRRGLGKTLELSPNHKLAKQTLGEIDHAVPGIAGGSDDRAEKAYLDILKRDPNFTPTMVLLAKLYRDQGEEKQAREWAQKALDAKSSVPNDWKKFDKAEAQKLLKELAD